MADSPGDPFAERKARFDHLRGWAELAAAGNADARSVLAQTGVSEELRSYQQRVAAFTAAFTAQEAEQVQPVPAPAVDTKPLERGIRSLEAKLRSHERTVEARAAAQKRCEKCGMSLGPATAWLAARGCIYRGSGACPVLGS